jgi:hypothetical protein
MHKTQYERLLSREKKIGVSPSRTIKPIHEKIREETMQHFSETYGKRPIGVHGTELPKFSENLKEYWKQPTPSSTKNSFKKLTIISHGDASEANIGGSSERRVSGWKKEKEEEYLKPTQITHAEVVANKEFNRNSRWTNYHYVFMQKSGNEVEKSMAKSTTPDVKKGSKMSSTPKSLIVDRMLRRGNYSPAKEIFRSTGFA